MQEDFKERLKRLRNEQKKLQKDMGELLGVKRSTYGSYETGVNVPPADKIKMLADYFDVTVDYLLCRENENDSSEDIETKLDGVLRLLESEKDLFIHGAKIDDDTRKLLLNGFRNFIGYVELVKNKK